MQTATKTDISANFEFQPTVLGCFGVNLGKNLAGGGFYPTRLDNLSVGLRNLPTEWFNLPIGLRSLSVDSFNFPTDCPNLSVDWFDLPTDWFNLSVGLRSLSVGRFNLSVRLFDHPGRSGGGRVG